MLEQRYFFSFFKGIHNSFNTNYLAMNKISYHLFYFLLLLALSSCQSSYYHLSELDASPPIQDQLPPLAIEMDWPSLEHNYAIDFAAIPSSEIGQSDYYSSFADARMNDARVLMEREARHTLCQQGSKIYGTVLCKVVAHNSYYDLQALTVTSILTGFIPNLFGMPLSRKQSEIILEFSIYDIHGHLMGTFEGQGYSQKTIGLYYGRQAERRTHTQAVKQALEEIRTKIAKQALQLSEELMYHESY